jgi:LPXTG-site transpeptidase (sortase) family protein
MVLAYPLTASALKTYQEKTSVTTFEASGMTEQEKIEMRQSIGEYNKTLQQGEFYTQIDSLTSAEGAPVSHFDFFNTGEVLGTLVIPVIKEKLPIYFGAGENVLRVGVGLMEKTSYPGSLPGHAVITGHRGTYDATIFRNLDKVGIGDVFYIQDKLNVLKYKVFEIKTVEPMDGRLIKLVPDRDLVTLLTCTPYIFNTHRLLITAERAAFDEGELEGLLETGAEIVTVNKAAKGVAPEITGVLKAPEKSTFAKFLELSWEIKAIILVLVLVGIGSVIAFLRSRARSRRGEHNA